MFKRLAWILPLALLSLGQAECPTADPTVIMPLGDSITDGFYAPGGYRVDLYPQLTSAGMDVDYVGSLQNGPVTLPDQDHEGHSGWRIDQLQANVGAWLPLYQPERILLIIGTNDLFQGFDVPNAPARHDALVGSMLQLAPGAHVVVASIPPASLDANMNANVVRFNAEIKANTEGRMAAGQPVSWVDIYGVLTPEDMVDGVHPNRAGYSKMADVFTDALLSLR